MVAIIPLLRNSYNGNLIRRVYVPREEGKDNKQKFDVYQARISQRLPEGGLILVLEDKSEIN